MDKTYPNVLRVQLDYLDILNDNVACTRYLEAFASPAHNYEIKAHNKRVSTYSPALLPLPSRVLLLATFRGLVPAL
jgi:hypothetical protein